MNFKPENKQIIKLGIRWIAFILIGIFIALVGVASNNIAVWSNHNYMPVKADIGNHLLDSGDGIHYYYGKFSQVNYPYLTDIFPLNYYYGKGIFSIGDFFIYIGYSFFVLSFLIGGFFFIRNSLRIRRKYLFGY